MSTHSQPLYLTLSPYPWAGVHVHTQSDPLPYPVTLPLSRGPCPHPVRPSTLPCHPTHEPGSMSTHSQTLYLILSPYPWAGVHVHTQSDPLPYPVTLPMSRGPCPHTVRPSTLPCHPTHEPGSMSTPSQTLYLTLSPYPWAGVHVHTQSDPLPYPVTLPMSRGPCPHTVRPSTLPCHPTLEPGSMSTPSQTLYLTLSPYPWAGVHVHTQSDPLPYPVTLPMSRGPCPHPVRPSTLPCHPTLEPGSMSTPSQTLYLTLSPYPWAGVHVHTQSDPLPYPVTLPMSRGPCPHPVRPSTLPCHPTLEPGSMSTPSQTLYLILLPYPWAGVHVHTQSDPLPYPVTLPLSRGPCPHPVRPSTLPCHPTHEPGSMSTPSQTLYLTLLPYPWAGVHVHTQSDPLPYPITLPLSRGPCPHTVRPSTLPCHPTLEPGSMSTHSQTLYLTLSPYPWAGVHVHTQSDPLPYPVTLPMSRGPCPHTVRPSTLPCYPTHEPGSMSTPSQTLYLILSPYPWAGVHVHTQSDPLPYPVTLPMSRGPCPHPVRPSTLPCHPTLEPGSMSTPSQTLYLTLSPYPWAGVHVHTQSDPLPYPVTLPMSRGPCPHPVRPSTLPCHPTLEPGSMSPHPVRPSTLPCYPTLEPGSMSTHSQTLYLTLSPYPWAGVHVHTQSDPLPYPVTLPLSRGPCPHTVRPSTISCKNPNSGSILKPCG